MSNYKIPTSDSFNSPMPRLRPSGLASRNNIKPEEPEQGPLERFFSLFRSSGGENKPPENKSSASRAMKFYDTSNNKPTTPSEKTVSSSPMRIGKARAELDLFEELDVVAPGVITVTSGDTLSAIARDNNTTVVEIQKVNPTITNVNQIKVGQNIKVPNAPVVKSGPAGLMVKKPTVYTSPKQMSEREILARTIQAEASGEAYDGKVAVGAVIANRAASGRFGKGIDGVILKRGQFSPWNSWTGYAGGSQGKDMMNIKVSKDSYKAADSIIGGTYVDKTGGATHYVNTKVSKPKWLSAMKGRKRGTVQLGNHLFGNADNNKTYDGKSWLTDRKSETTDQPLVAAPTTVEAVQRIIQTKADGIFGPMSRKKAKEYLAKKNITVGKDITDEELMRLVVGGN
jgi:spore germination cell wall hydrolase CwlJ-like protein